MIVTYKYIDPTTNNEVINTVDESQVGDITTYLNNLHETVLCDTDECNGEDCKIWIQVDGEWFLAGI